MKRPLEPIDSEKSKLDISSNISSSIAADSDLYNIDLNSKDYINISANEGNEKIAEMLVQHRFEEADKMYADREKILTH